ncbi:MAG: alanine dehydrogenase [Ignavibacteriales bacterium]|nr:alanine dehydrogenase [Ignavibacteriales bacterium]
MNIGILKEDFQLEHRVALTPVGVQSLADQGHRVFVQRDAGSMAHFPDEEYRNASASIVYSAEEVINRSEVVLRIAPPSTDELKLFSPGQVLFSFLYLAVSSEKKIKELLERRLTAISYELIENERGELSVLQVSSEIAGQLAIHIGANYLQGRHGGRGTLLGCVPGVPPATVVILGAGAVGRTAARSALGTGAQVIVLDKEVARLRVLEEQTQYRVTTALATTKNIERAVKYADVLIGAVLMKAEKAPHLVTEAMVQTMKKGSVIIDVSIDEGGCIATSRPTRADDPIFIAHDVVHYCVPNIPSLVARTATIALTNALLPIVSDVAEVGIQRAIRENSGLAKGVCTYDGACTNPVIAKAFTLSAKHLRELLN